MRIAFGDGKKIRHHRHATQIFRNNPNIAFPGDEVADDIEWFAHYAGNRVYCRMWGNKWLFLPGKVTVPGQIFFDDEELEFAEKFPKDAVLIEPNIPQFKSVAVNKQWPVERYSEVAHHLIKSGREIFQFHYGPPYGPGFRIAYARQVKAPTFRHALAVLARCSLYVGPEGGLHHGAAAVGVPAVVIFGGFISPQITGYLFHKNFFVGEEPCGALHRCEHCRQALLSISVEQIVNAAKEKLNERLSYGIGCIVPEIGDVIPHENAMRHERVDELREL